MASNSTPKPSRAGLAMRSGDFARFGATACAIAAGGAIAAAGVAWYVADRTNNELRRERVAELATCTADAIGGLIAAGDLSGARRVVAGVAQATSATSCRVELPNGGVLADSTPSRVTVRDLPDPWPEGEVTPVRSWFEGVRNSVSVPVIVGPERHASLIVETIPESAAIPRELGAGVGLAIGVSSLGAFWAFRRARRGLRGVLAVSEAVAVASAGEAHEEALRIDPSAGPLADAWNGLVPRLLTVKTSDLGVTKDVPDAGVDTDAASFADAFWQGVVLLDESGQVRWLNGAACLLLGIRRESAAGMRLDQHLNAPELQELLARALIGEVTARQSVEIASGADEEEGMLRVSVRSLHAAGGNHVVVVLEDVSQQRIVDQARSAFVAQATHELRTPLTNVRLYLEELIDAQSEGKELATEVRGKCLDVISRETRRLERMVGDMLSLSEIESGTLKLHTGDVRLEPMFRDLESDFSAQAAERSIVLEFKLPPKLPVVVGDRDKLQMTLANLIGNALKYTPERGTVTVSVRQQGADLRVDVTDSGIGIREDELELIFRTFYRSKDTRITDIKGSGLGLPIARQIARLHGGDITVTSVVDRGSTFSLVIPATAPVSMAA